MAATTCSPAAPTLILEVISDSTSAVGEVTEPRGERAPRTLQQEKPRIILGFYKKKVEAAGVEPGRSVNPKTGSGRRFAREDGRFGERRLHHHGSGWSGWRGWFPCGVGAFWAHSVTIDCPGSLDQWLNQFRLHVIEGLYL